MKRLTKSGFVVCAASDGRFRILEGSLPRQPLRLGSLSKVISSLAIAAELERTSFAPLSSDLTSGLVHVRHDDAGPRFVYSSRAFSKSLGALARDWGSISELVHA